MRSSGNRFGLYFQTGPALQPRDDVVLHLSVRPNEYRIVTNHYHNKNWGGEIVNGGCPIRMGEHFDITVSIESAQFRVSQREKSGLCVKFKLIFFHLISDCCK